MEQEYKEKLLAILNKLGEVKLKRGLLGGETIYLNEMKLGGIIFDKGTKQFLLQIKPTKAGERLLLEYPTKYAMHLPYSGTPSFTFISIENEDFFLTLFRATYEELRSH